MAAEGVLVALLIAGAVRIESTTPCPTAAAVEARLQALGSAPSGAPDRALVRDVGGKLTLILLRADGSAVVERQIEVQGSCADLAGAVALIITVWQAQEHPALPRAPSLAPAPPPPERRPFSLEARTDVFASFAGTDVSPGAALLAEVWRRRWGLAVSVSGTTPREQALGRGRAAWSRASVGLGPARRLIAGWARVDLRLEALFGLTAARGSGYQTNEAPVGSTFGGGAGLGVSHAFGNLVISAGAAGAFWLAQELAVDASGDRRAVPRAEARAGAGVGFRFDL